MTATDSIRFWDTTPRDGQEAAGVAFSLDDAVHIAVALDAVGPDSVIEVAIAAAGAARVAVQLVPAGGGR